MTADLLALAVLIGCGLACGLTVLALDAIREPSHCPFDDHPDGFGDWPAVDFESFDHANGDNR
jgi:hypothetical protein